jgi:hypothetical protein
MVAVAGRAVSVWVPEGRWWVLSWKLAAKRCLPGRLDFPASLKRTDSS